MTDKPDSELLRAEPLAHQAVRQLAEQVAALAAEKAATRAAERAADIVAQRVVEKMFLHLGIDINDSEALKAIRDNLSFLSRVHEGANDIKRTVIKTAIGALIAGVIALLVLGFKDWVFSPLK